MRTLEGPKSSRRVGAGVAGACSLLVLLLAGCQGSDGSAHLPNRAARVAVESDWPELEGRPAAEPSRVRISDAGIDAPVVPLDVDSRGALIPPDTGEVAGWWRNGPEPGERGPAVIAGHVDTSVGPAVFYRIPKLSEGTEVVIDRADGTSAVFTTYRVEEHPKDEFPTGSVYGATALPELRLITCGGRFDAAGGRYLANVVVFARRTG
ncbi:class F sortase [Saccharopolyspora rhizosphaerae]|uniref:Class F sortase n=1 Tax=Saccharopolyspora rhizosphaerae TaxID=2492662 RepID=A0A3R8P3H2_9PSEU|nr:class F sortase [Saccharopolyspora rhizosphaerae]RRO19231.1 class F sortase [Saccharopolyspora rhizosphaerae]